VSGKIPHRVGIRTTKIDLKFRHKRFCPALSTLTVPFRSERREQLEQVTATFTDPIRLNPSFHVSLADFTAMVRKLGLEGIVAKRSDPIYIPGKESDAWRNHRFNQEDEFVIGGYIPGGQNFSELLIEEERGQELVFIKRLIARFIPRPSQAPQHLLYFLPLMHGHGSFRPAGRLLEFTSSRWRTHSMTLAADLS